MANPSALTNKPAVLEATTTEQSVTLESRGYSLAHDGEDTAGVAATNTIYLSFSADVDADESEGVDKFKLKNGRTVDLPAGFTTLKFRTEAGSPTFSVIPRAD